MRSNSNNNKLKFVRIYVLLLFLSASRSFLFPFDGIIVLLLSFNIYLLNILPLLEIPFQNSADDTNLKCVYFDVKLFIPVVSLLNLFSIP